MIQVLKVKEWIESRKLKVFMEDRSISVGEVSSYMNKYNLVNMFDAVKMIMAQRKVDAEFVRESLMYRKMNQ